MELAEWERRHRAALGVTTCASAPAASTPSARAASPLLLSQVTRNPARNEKAV